jgi:hypothetical protein
LNKKIGHYICARPGDNTDDYNSVNNSLNNINFPKNKALRGFNNAVAARLLTPQAYITYYDRAPEYVYFFFIFLLHMPAYGYLYRIVTAKIMTGKIKLTQKSWPNFIYDEERVDPEFKDVKRGMFQSRFLKRVCA